MIDMPWLVGLIIAIAFFAITERYGCKHHERVNTLSMAIYEIGSKWPLSIWIMGVFAGGLAVHFFWHWCPPGSTSLGLLYLFDLG